MTKEVKQKIKVIDPSKWSNKQLVKFYVDVFMCSQKVADLLPPDHIRQNIIEAIKEGDPQTAGRYILKPRKGKPCRRFIVGQTRNCTVNIRFEITNLALDEDDIVNKLEDGKIAMIHHHGAEFGDLILGAKKIGSFVIEETDNHEDDRFSVEEEFE